MYYLNDNYYKNDKQINITDRGLLLGDGIFTTIRVLDSQLLYFDKHIARLKHNAKVIYLNIVLDDIQLKNICNKLIAVNKLSSAVIRITITRGESSRGINIDKNMKPNLLITSTKYEDTISTVKLCKTSVIRNEKSLLTYIKSLSYLESILAKKEAIDREYDDGIMINTCGFVTECSIANIFFITADNKIVTPKVSDGILPGIVREEILSICQINNIPYVEQSIRAEHIAQYIAGFVTNSVIGIKTVSLYENIKFIEEHAILNQIKEIYNQRNKRFENYYN